MEGMKTIKGLYQRRKLPAGREKEKVKYGVLEWGRPRRNGRGGMEVAKET